MATADQSRAAAEAELAAIEALPAALQRRAVGIGEGGLPRVWFGIDMPLCIMKWQIVIHRKVCI